MFVASRVDLKTCHLNSTTARLLTKLLHNTECCCVMWKRSIGWFSIGDASSRSYWNL